MPDVPDEAAAVAKIAADVLRTTRQDMGLTQAQLAERVKTTQAQIARWESGRRSPTVRDLARLLGAMGFELKISAAPRQREPEPERARPRAPSQPASADAGDIRQWLKDRTRRPAEDPPSSGS